MERIQVGCDENQTPIGSVHWADSAKPDPRIASALTEMINLLEGQGLGALVDRIELYSPNDDGLVPCLVWINPDIPSLVPPQGELLLNKIHGVQRDIERKFLSVPWLFATQLTDTETDSESSKQMFGANTQIQAIAR